MKMRLGAVRRLIREMLMIKDYASTLAQWEAKEQDIESRYPGALGSLIHESHIDAIAPRNISNALILVWLFERDLINEHNGLLFVDANSTDTLVWDAPNSWWWSEGEHPEEFNRIAGVDTDDDDDVPAEEPERAKCDKCGGTGELDFQFYKRECDECGGTGEATS